MTVLYKVNYVSQAQALPLLMTVEEANEGHFAVLKMGIYVFSMYSYCRRHEITTLRNGL